MSIIVGWYARRPSPGPWWQFRRAVEKAEVLDVGRLVASGCVRGLADADRAAYDAPVPRRVPQGRLAGDAAAGSDPPPTTRRPPRTAPPGRRWGTYASPFLVAFSDSDPITAAMGPILARHVAGASYMAHPTLTDAGHFLQEDAGERLGQLVAGFVDEHHPWRRRSDGLTSQASTAESTQREIVRDCP